MQNRTPGIPEQATEPPSPTRADIDAYLGAELASVVSAARRRALRDGDQRIDTAHLLHSLIESDPLVRAAFGDGTPLTKVLGLLVQRSIGYGLAWQGRPEDSGTVPRVPLTAAEGWSPAAAGAMESAARQAARRGEPHADGLDVLSALASDRSSRAVEVLRRAGVDPATLRRSDADGGRPAEPDAADR
ncbi:Clp protease N-terminal domain-containing protein [uncultured Streptomyces sp.]|uniref:Clp protease N-terminal domain-containing protein n=1 Tax=uncultured Streptomyces sp. TaxID=174707 RepID=UPI002618855E|nr:Clp protease N-terminal domain-containing protein [uncultured Streptomyces sp.]